MIFTMTLWPAVQAHAWKYSTYPREVDALLWHATRGGQSYPGTVEFGAAVNWFKSPNNRTAQGYAGISNVLIGPDHICEVVPMAYMPRFSSHPSDEHAISLEVCQSNHGQPIESATIANCVRFARWAHAEYGVPLERVWPQSDGVWSGMAGHEDTRQGVAQGKSDPGAAFWEPFLAALEAEDMDPRVDALIAALGGQAAIDAWNANGNSLLAGYAAEQIKLGGLIQQLEAHTKAPHAGGLAPGTEFTAKVK